MGESSRATKTSKIAWGAIGAFLVGVLVIGYGMKHQGLSDVTIEPGKTTVRFIKPGELSSRVSEESQTVQALFENRLAKLEKDAQQRSETVQPSAETANLNGSWLGANGLTYVIRQYADRAVMQEVYNGQITGTGWGQVRGNNVTFESEAANGVQSRWDLQLVQADTLQGTITFSNGMTSGAQLQRTGE